VDESGAVTKEGDIRLATSDPGVAFGDAELILVTVPATAMGAVAETVLMHSGADATIGVVPGNGGSECAFGKCIARGNTFFGIERVPAIARIVREGETVRSTGYRDELHVASLPAKDARGCADLVGGIFGIRTAVIPGYLNLTMTPSNPILHTTRLRTLFGGWREGVVYESVPLFYEGWDDASSDLLIACDEEVQAICRALPDFDLRYVKSLREHYESPTVEAMTRKIASIPAFKGLATPTVEVEGGLVPDLRSRYFTADFSYGLAIIEQVAEFAGVRTPRIDETMAWYKSIAIESAEFRFADYGICDREALGRFYLR
jgi:hypothetical protein